MCVSSVHVYACVHIHTCIHVEATGPLVDTGFLTVLELINLAGLTSQGVPGICLSPLSQYWNYKHATMPGF